MTHPLNKTLAYEDLRLPEIRPTHSALKRWVLSWFFKGNRLGVNGASRRRLRVRGHKMWEYSRSMALTGVSAPVRGSGGPFTVLDVGGAMTPPLFYLGGLGDTVVSLDIDKTLTAETNRTAERNHMNVKGLTTNLVEEDPSGSDLGVDEAGFDRVYCLCVIEHIVPPGQGRVAERMGKLVKPGGQLCITFDYGANAGTEAPVLGPEQVEDLKNAIGLPLMGNDSFEDDGRRYPLRRDHPELPFTFGSLFFQKPLPVKIVRTRRGARLVEGDVVLSEIRNTPGPTHTLFDVLAACVAALAPGPRTVLLGFAGGGMIAPLRAMGFHHPIDAVDLDRTGERLFRELSGDWAGKITLAQQDAVQWLRARRASYDLIVEDLSVPSPAGTVKPYESFDPLPHLVRSRLKRGGVAVINMLPLPGSSWASMLARVAIPHERALEVRLDEYENRLVLAGHELPPAKEASARVRKALRAIESNQARKIAVRTISF